MAKNGESPEEQPEGEQPTSGRTKAPPPFGMGESVETPKGTGTVIDVRGNAWVKLEGVKPAWWRTKQLKEAQAEMAAAAASS